MIKPFDDIISWLMYLDIEYLTDEKCGILSELDINNPDDQINIINIAMGDDFKLMNEVSKNALKRVLEELPFYLTNVFNW